MVRDVLPASNDEPSPPCTRDWFTVGRRRRRSSSLDGVLMSNCREIDPVDFSQARESRRLKAKTQWPHGAPPFEIPAPRDRETYLQPIYVPSARKRSSRRARVSRHRAARADIPRSSSISNKSSRARIWVLKHRAAVSLSEESRACDMSFVGGRFRVDFEIFLHAASTCNASLSANETSFSCK